MPAANRKELERPPATPGADSLGPVLVEPARKPPSMRQAVAQARREVALTLPEVIRTLARESIGGSVNHLKLYLELSGVLKGGLAAPPRVAPEKTLEEFFLERWAQDKAYDEADRAARVERDRDRAEEVLNGV